MVGLGALLIPIAVTSVLGFLASFLLWAVLPWHKKDYGPLPDEDELVAVMRAQSLAHGEYVFPHCSGPDEYKNPELLAKFKAGPVGQITVRRPGLPNMGLNMGLTFLHFVVVTTLIAYVTGRALPAGTAYLEVFRIVGTIAILAYSASSIPNAIWFGRPWGNQLRDVLDGVVYGLLTAGAFAWLWPS